MLNANSRGLNISNGSKYIRKFCSGGPNVSTIKLSGGPNILIHLNQGSLSRDNWTPYFSSPGPNISKYLDPRIIYFNFDEIFGPGWVLSPVILHSTHCVKDG